MSQLPRLSSSIRERFAQDKQAYEQGGRKVLSDRKSLARELSRPQALVQSGAAVLDGLMEIHEGKNRVVMAIKEQAVKARELTTTLDVYA